MLSSISFKNARNLPFFVTILHDGALIDKIIRQSWAKCGWGSNNRLWCFLGFDKETQHLINDKILSSERIWKSDSKSLLTCATDAEHALAVYQLCGFVQDGCKRYQLACNRYQILRKCKHQTEIELFAHVPVRPFWKLKIFFFHYLQWHDWSGLAFLSWFWQFTWDQLLWFPVASQQIPIGSTFATFVKSWDVFHKEITFCF